MTEQLIIDGQRVDASDGGTFEVCDPSSGGPLATVAKATKADVDRAVKAAHAALESKAWGGAPPAERGRAMIRIAQALRDRVGGAGHAREPRQRQAAAAIADRRPGRGPLLRVLRRHRRQDHGQHHPARSRVPRLHRPRADRRVRPDHPVELPDPDRRARHRAGDRRGVHGRPEAGRGRADDGDAARRDRARVRPAARRRQRAARHGAGGRGRARQSSRHQSAHLHRLGLGRHRRRQDGRRQRRPRGDGARRQVAQHRVRGRRPRSHRPGRRQRDLPERRPDVLGRLAPARPAEGPRRARRAAHRARGVDARGPRRQRSRHGPDHLEEAARDD